ncbi:MAG TPA: ABC transporter substrate-binding protein [Dehalococcoidia bacterium]
MRNPDFFRPGLPYLDAVEIKVINDASARLANFLSGAVAYHELAGPQDVDQVKKTGAQITKYGSFSASHKVFNVAPNGQKEFRDVRVRQAFDLAIDRDVILQNVVQGDGFWGGPCIPPGYGDMALSQDEVKGLYKQDLKKAKQLMTAAGVDSLAVPMEYSNIDNLAGDEMPLMKQMLAQIGINIDLKPAERTAYLQHQVDGNFKIQTIGSGAGPDPDSLLFPYYHSKGGKNWGRASDPELDARIEKERGMLDVKERNAYIKQMTKDWQNYLYRLHTVYQNLYVAWAGPIKGTFVPKGADWQGMEGVSLG